MQEAYPELFKPLQLGSRTLANRIGFASMFSGRARGGAASHELIQFYVNRAKGGAGLIVSEPFGVLRSSDVFGAQMRVNGRGDHSDLKRWSDAVHEHDVCFIGQLQESGRGDIRPQRKPFSLAPSALADDLSWSVPHAVTLKELRDVQEDFVSAAASLYRAGFDGVELSAGHGHLVHQFLSPWSNRRDDEYGGALENRIRFLVEILIGIREACGERFILGVRLPGNDGVANSIGWEEAALIATAVTKASLLDYVNFVGGSQAASLHMHVPDMHGPNGPYVDDTARMRPHIGGAKLVSGGRIVEPALAEAVLASGKADIVFLGRPLVADPAWPLKAKANRDHDIRKCVSCNNCWGEIVHRGKPLSCDNNPRVALPDEVDWRPVKAAVRRRLVVVGSGPAGLEAAWVAAARGHEVTLFSQSPECGGKARLYGSLPGAEAARSVIDYQIGALAKFGVTLRMGERAELETIFALRPHAVIVASGGEMTWPAHLPEDWRELGVIPDLWTLIADLPRMGADPGVAVLYDFDGSDVTYSAAEALAARYTRVVIINPVEAIARDEALVKRQSIYKRLLKAGVEICDWSELSSETDLAEGRVVIRNTMSGATHEIGAVSLLSYATPRRPRDELAPQLKALGVKTHVIGDAFVPRPLMAVLAEAHRLGAQIFKGEDKLGLTVEKALKLSGDVIAQGKKAGLNAAVTIVDTGGRVLASARNENVGYIHLDVARKKALASLNFGAPTHAVLEMIRADSFLLQSVQGESEISIIPGGFAIYEDGVLIGALGVAGGAYPQDQKVGEAALAAAGYSGAPG